MKIIKKFFYIFWLFPFFIFCDEELQVSLLTKNPMYPAYVSKIFSENSSLDKSYVDQVESVLFFDLQNCGYFSVGKTEKTKEIILFYSDDIAFDQDIWKNEKLAYIIRSKMEKSKLKTDIFSTADQSLKNSFSVDLTENLSIDRKLVHELTDKIIREVLGKKSITTMHIIYSLRTVNPNKEKNPWFSEIWMCDYDGKNEKRITHENSYCVHPVFIPSSSGPCDEFFYVSYKTGQPKIYKSSLSTNISSPVLSLRGCQLLPSISPKGDMLSFISDAAGRPDLFIQKLNEKQECEKKPLQLFSKPKATQASSTISPDGQKIAFVSDKDGPCRIYIMKVPANLQMRQRPICSLITKKNRQNVTPSWSYDGTKLAYSAKTDGIRQIWVYDFETDEEWQLTTGPDNKENPIWGRDNLHIVYNTEEAFTSELFLINLNQRKAIKISSGEGQKRFAYFENVK